ncbi:MAG TPA: hypothetical protein PKY87_12850 [Terricaulis sp.]|nr:hypothetical protein [Terricaulis sp.]
MFAKVIEGLQRQRKQHLHEAGDHDREADRHRRQMRHQMTEAVKRRSLAWQCEQAIIRLGGTVED